HTSTTALSNIVSIDESPVLEGLIYAGTDDGLLQVTEDGGRNWRKVEDFPTVPKWTYVSDVFASPRDANVVFVAFNNWQRDDFNALREMTPQTLADAAQLYPTRDASYAYTVTGEGQASEPTWVAGNPPIGATLTYSVNQPMPADAKLVLTITDDSGRVVRRL